jgi:hypothetical protein
VCLLLVLPEVVLAAESGSGTWSAWVWMVLLFATTFVIGVFGVMAGIGGGVLFVPLVSGFFPFHIDFVRGAGLFIALGSSLAAAPYLLRQNLASLRLAMPVALIASAFSIVGAQLGLWISALNPAYIQGALGVVILGIAMIMLRTPIRVFPVVSGNDPVAKWLGLQGWFVEETTGERMNWTVHRAAVGLSGFVLVGLLAGIFGLGAGWANVPLLNLVMGAPLKIAVATSSFSLSITDTTAAWVYFNRGAVLPALVVPSLVGVMLGAMLGSRMLPHVPAFMIRRLVIGVLMLAGIRSVLKAVDW